MSFSLRSAVVLAAAMLALSTLARADEPAGAAGERVAPEPAGEDTLAAGDEAPRVPPRVAKGDVPHANGLVYLNPALAENTWSIPPGRKAYARRLAFSPGYGTLGKHELYTFRLAYNPNAWLGWEAGVGHNPGDSVHALLHTVSAVLRYPIPWRVQPYVTGGYGMLMVFPGESINADPVTSNALVVGGGLELYVRNDVAIRAELKQATVFGGVKGSDETVTYGYREASIGFAFYRALGGASE